MSAPRHSDSIHCACMMLDTRLGCSWRQSGKSLQQPCWSTDSKGTAMQKPGNAKTFVSGQMVHKIWERNLLALNFLCAYTRGQDRAYVYIQACAWSHRCVHTRAGMIWPTCAYTCGMIATVCAYTLMILLMCACTRGHDRAYACIYAKAWSIFCVHACMGIIIFVSAYTRGYDRASVCIYVWGNICMADMVASCQESPRQHFMSIFHVMQCTLSDHSPWYSQLAKHTQYIMHAHLWAPALGSSWEWSGRAWTNRVAQRMKKRKKQIFTWSILELIYNLHNPDSWTSLEKERIILQSVLRETQQGSPINFLIPEDFSFLLTDSNCGMEPFNDLIRSPRVHLWLETL